MRETFQKKSLSVKEFLTKLPTSEARYKALIEMGRTLPPISPHLKIPQHLVSGCQSNLYLISRIDDGFVYFEAASDALISAGLAALLIAVYSGESPETILKEPPRFVDELGLHASLSPSRSNGLSNIHLRIKQEALKFLMASSER